MSMEFQDFSEYLIQEFSKLQIPLEDKQVRMFFQYYEELIIWNKKMNLTAITEGHEVIDKHFFDSASLLSAYPIKEKGVSFCDIGTGAGFPGIPLAILRPDCSFTLMDSLQKRIDFLDHMIQLLSLENVRTIHGRFEDLGKKTEFREKYDYVVSRAVARLPMLLEFGVPFSKKGGHLLFYKSKELSLELAESENALTVLNTQVEDVIKIPAKEERSLLVLYKFENTSEKYPRNPGRIKKNPL